LQELLPVGAGLLRRLLLGDFFKGTDRESKVPPMCRGAILDAGYLDDPLSLVGNSDEIGFVEADLVLMKLDDAEAKSLEAYERLGRKL
jgi:hypothetical protein